MLHIRAKRQIIRDYFIRIHIQDRREITLSPREIELGYIGCPLLQRLLCIEISVDNIVGNLTNFTLVGMILLLRSFTGQPKLVHDALNSFMVYREPMLHEFLVYSPYTVSSFVFVEDSGDFRGYIHVSFLYFICLADLIVIC